MSLTTVTLALDDKLRSLRNSTFINASVLSTTDVNQPLTLGENIPYADESPERPLIQTRSKPVRSTTTGRAGNSSGGDMQPHLTIPTTARTYSPDVKTSAPQTPHADVSQDTIVVQTIGTNIGSLDSTVADVDAVSSDETDASTTSTAEPERSTPTVAAVASIIDRDMIREMSRILQTLERKATKLNRSLSLNYKSHKDCCCYNPNNSIGNQPQLYGQTQAIQTPRSSQGRLQMANQHHIQYTSAGSQRTSNPNQHFSSTSNTPNLPPLGISSATSVNTLTKDEKTDKNTNKKRQIQHDVKQRRNTNRSIKRRHTVGGTHDFDAVNKSLSIRHHHHQRQQYGVSSVSSGSSILPNVLPSHCGTESSKENHQPDIRATTEENQQTVTAPTADVAAEK